MSAMTLTRLIHEKRVVVCCGAGGVGKTTVSASLPLSWLGLLVPCRWGLP